MMVRDLLPRGRDALPMALAWIAGIVSVLFLLQRFRYGIDFTDETFSIAMPYRYVLGDRPFVDEISIQQTAGVLLFPFVWLWVKVTGGSTGLVLFVRLLHFLVFKGAAAIGTWLAARRLLATKAAAIAAAFVPLAYVPHSIPNVGYNVIAMAFLVAGAGLLVAGINEPSDRKARSLFFAGGVTLSLMSFAYPPMAVAAIAAGPSLLVCAPRRRFVALAAFAAGGLAGVLLVAPAFAFGGLAGLRRSLAWGAQASSTHGVERLRQMLDAYWTGLPPIVGWLAVALVVAGLSRSRALAVAATLAALGTTIWWFRDDMSYLGTNRSATYLGTLAPAFVFVARPDRQLVRSAALVVVPSFAAAAAGAVFSTQNLDAAALGFVASVVLTVILAARALERAGTGAAFALLPAVFVSFVYVERAWTFMYRDAPIASLTETVRHGPFKGLRTTRDRVEMLNELRDIVRTFDRPGGHVLVLYEAPGLYLASRMPPSAHCVWEATYGDLDGMRSFFQRKANGQGIVLRVKGTPQVPVDAEIAPPERRIHETRHFVVYRDR